MPCMRTRRGKAPDHMRVPLNSETPHVGGCRAVFQGLGFRGSDSGLVALNLATVQGSGFRVQGLGFRV